MGKNNQQRRAAKRRERLRRTGGSRGPRPTAPGRDAYQEGHRFGFDGYPDDRWGADPVPDEPAHDPAHHRAHLTPEDLLERAGQLDRADLARLVEPTLLTRSPADLRVGEERLTLRLLAVLAALWEGGWQPADILHVARRLDGRCADLAAALVTEQARRTGAEAAAPGSWLSQLSSAAQDALAAGFRPGPAVVDFRAVEEQIRAGSQQLDAWVTVLRLTGHLEQLPRLQRLVEPPSAWRRGAAQRPATVATDSGRDRVLTKIRGLLAKAEATTYAAEAEALTAKAQELMTRHSVDEALLHAGDDRPVEVTAIRVHIQAPYGGEKVSLLTQVARANRCKAIWLESLGIATLVGTPLDVGQVELLFTSLLIQATRAMAEAGAARPGSFDRSATFRRSFLVSYAIRIGERLTEASTTATAAYGTELVPVLRRQTEAVDDEFDRLFPDTYERSSNARYSQRGWQAGRAAADRATLVAGGIAAS